MKHFLTAVSQPSVSIFHPALHCSRSTPQDTEDAGWNVGKSPSMGRACSPSPLFILWSFSFRLKEINTPEEWIPTCLRWSCWCKGHLPEWEEWMGTGAFLPPSLQKSGPEDQGSTSEEDWLLGSDDCLPSGSHVGPSLLSLTLPAPHTYVDGPFSMLC